MGNSERKQSIAEGRKLINTMQGKEGPELTVEEVEGFARDLAGFAQEIVDDFEETRENLSEKQGLLDRWEENTGYQSEEWDTVVTELGNYQVEEADLETSLEEIVQFWEQGPQ